ncbi:MAG TPA: PDZ domain-containing protein [Pyrinomonadaceae bacterium]
MSQELEVTCSNCHSRMPSDQRFCRNCGFRLTHNMGGYTGSNQYLAPGEAPTAVLPGTQKKKRRMSGMSWIFVGLLVFFIGAAAFTALVAPAKRGGGVGVGVSRAPVVKSFLGVNGFNETDDGVILECVSAPGGPADKAGLVGGDVILSVDGQPIRDEDQIEEIMRQTPIGKTINIEYVRDGEKKTAQLTTISEDESKRLTKEFERRPEGRGQFGYEDGDADTIPVPGTKIRGVILNTILRSRPADLAGIKNGDIVVEFDGIPIRHDQEFLMRVRRALPYSTVKVVVMRPKGEPPTDGQLPEFEKVEIPVKMGKQ